MNKFIDWLIESLKYITKKNKLYIIAFYNKTRFLINKNFTLSKIYKPIIEEKTSINKNLKESLRDVDNKSKEAEKNILNLQNENALLQSKISIIQNLLTKRHD
jgi:hypothetical protein